MFKINTDRAKLTLAVDRAALTTQAIESLDVVVMYFPKELIDRFKEFFQSVFSFGGVGSVLVYFWA
jgi:hypothetical protein